ncbi:hypothetical protein [Dyella silvae]|uniref:hypothetical protein n=1 Tax=Dyella silvae TaxID=2994424 RepID=UPI002264B097|nr:hypothetical protein [Dyella silvae]
MCKLLQAVCLIALLLIMPWSASSAEGVPAGPCRMIDPSTCVNAKDFSHASGFSEALGHFIGSSKVSYFQSDRSLSGQAMSGLGGAGAGVVTLADKRYLFSACPSRDCRGSAAAIIVNEYGQIEALGFSSFHCDAACDDYRHLDFYVRKNGDNDPLIAALKNWATSDSLRKTLPSTDADNGIDGRTSIHVLP